MTERTISLKLKLTQPNETKKSLDALNRVSTKWDKTFGKEGLKVVESQTKQVGILTRSWDTLGRSISGTGDHFRTFGRGLASSMGDVRKFGEVVTGVGRKVFNLKNAIAGTAIGGAAMWGVHKLFEEGSAQIKTRQRLTREFGDRFGSLISETGDRAGIAGGIQGDEASRGLIPLAEQLEAIQSGARFRGMRNPLTAPQAESLKAKNLKFGGNLLSRISTLAPEVDTEELGRVLGDALSGPEGIRSLVSTLHLSRRSRTLSEANEKGSAFKVLSPEERKQYGVTRAGQFLEQGDLVNLLLSRSGITDKAAADERKRFDFQIKSIKAQLTDSIGEIGSSALDTLTEKLGKGATAAERLQGYLASKEGKQTIHDIGVGVSKVVEGVVSIGQELPKIGAFLNAHKGTLMALAGAYGTTKLTPALPLGGGSSAPGSGAFNAGKAIPLIQTGIAASLGLNAYLGEKDVSSALGIKWKDIQNGFLGGGVDKTKIQELGRERLTKFYEELMNPTAPKEQAPVTLVNQLVAAAKDQPIQINNVTTVQLDGHTVAKSVEPHFVRRMDNRTGRGVSPVSKE